ncbi:hypothetical protein GCAAIG_12145 [Candidatus Electronema halotolerans]
MHTCHNFNQKEKQISRNTSWQTLLARANA